MKELNVITFIKNNGKRTSVSLSSIQIKVLDSLASRYKMSRADFLRELEHRMFKKMNLSNYIRDSIILELLLLLAIKDNREIDWEKIRR